MVNVMINMHFLLPINNVDKILFSVFLSHEVSDFDYFVETSMAAAPSMVASLLVDPSGLATCTIRFFSPKPHRHLNS